MDGIMYLDPRRFAIGWAAVKAVSGSDKDDPQLFRTVLVEMFREGVRLVAFNGCVAAMVWVSAEDDDYPEPGVDEKPDRTVIVQDLYNRGSSCLAHIKRMVAEATKKRAEVQLPRARFSVVTPHASLIDVGDELGDLAVFELVGVETVRVPVYDGEFPHWREWDTDMFGKEFCGIAADVLGSLAAVSKQCGGGDVIVRFGPSDSLRWWIANSEPMVSGWVDPTTEKASGVAADTDPR